MPHLQPLTLPRRPIVIVIGMLKGGSGKTTSAIFTGVRYALRGLAVEVIDGDQTSQSAYDWARQAAKNGTPLPFRVDRHPYAEDIAEEISDRRAAAAVDVIVIDAGGGDPSFLEEAASKADVLLMPLAPSGADARRIAATIKAAERGAARNESGLLAYTALVRADHRTSQPRRWRNQLVADGQPLLDQAVGARVLYSDAYGTCPAEAGEYEQLLAEVEAELPAPAVLT